MSQKKEDSENDIWEYKPLQKKKKRQDTLSATKAVSKRLCTSRRTTKSKNLSFSVRSPDKEVEGSGDCNADLLAHDLPSKSSPHDDTLQTDTAAEGPSSGDFCPMCQMPFSILVVQTQRWHVAECLDTNRDTCKECPDSLQCSSTFPNHYKKFNHTLLAHGRANSDAALLSLSRPSETSERTNVVDGLILETSQDSALSLSALSDRSVSPHRNNPPGTPLSNRNNGLLLLRSPGPDDFKKKKGWSSSSKKQKSISSSQESGSELSSTPVKAESERQACERLPEIDVSPDDVDDAISYSPLSEFPTETGVKMSECKKALFDNNAFENETQDSTVPFCDGFSSEDELLSQFIDNLETDNVQVKEPSSFNTQLESVTSLQLATSTITEDGTSAVSPFKISIQSPQSIVLEQLRESLISLDSQDFENLNDSSSVQSEQPHATSSQTTVVQSSQSMTPQKGQIKAGLKQTDIGVFFGLKPLTKKEKEAESGPNNEHSSSSTSSSMPAGQRRQRTDGGHGRRKADTAAADASKGTVTEDNGKVGGACGESGRGRARGWRGRWNRGNADGEGELPRCPFYKKISGTKFVVDAFSYGDIPGITAYFLTHFHSDHYGGLTKKGTFQIYCNKITGNLVKSKLRVSEQYVHILPMNTQVTVEGVTVIFLEANHCPGAAMLLFFLPNGQTVLHTGDFRADPSMETYPELLSCKVQTLYLDTTYCSPEYTFPKQQEAINFAVSTAFEVVTLNPRTLVVCGSYSVGKEKVFLALADVLGSKVCLSRDKYNTMCCLESEQVRQRITTDWKAAQVHVLPMMHLNFKKLQDYLARFSGRYDRLVAFKPTGWTFSQKVESVENIQPQISGNISIYGIPYSEHSSFLELKRFVQWLKPLKIIPTVNNGSWASRKAMEKCFSEWLAETKCKP